MPHERGEEICLVRRTDGNPATTEPATCDFADIRSTGLDSESFALKLLKEHGVAVVPGSAFGACGEGFVRMSYATSMEKLRLAAERIGKMLQ